jgi:hypothetical protein
MKYDWFKTPPPPFCSFAVQNTQKIPRWNTEISLSTTPLPTHDADPLLEGVLMSRRRTKRRRAGLCPQEASHKSNDRSPASLTSITLAGKHLHNAHIMCWFTQSPGPTRLGWLAGRVLLHSIALRIIYIQSYLPAPAHLSLSAHITAGPQQHPSHITWHTEYTPHSVTHTALPSHCYIIPSL